MCSSVAATIRDEPARARVVRSSESSLLFWKCRRLQADASCKPRPAHRGTVAGAVERTAPAIAAMLPLRALETIATAAAMNARVLEINIAICQCLVVGNKLPRRITELEYSVACRQASFLEECAELVHLITGLGKTHISLVTIPMIGMTLRAMRAPAYAAGFGALQEFLEEGYRTFRQIPDIDHFLNEIQSE